MSTQSVLDRLSVWDHRPHEENPIVDCLLSDVALAKAEIERLQAIIDSRPAINAGLPGTYIRWSQSIYVMEAAHVLETAQ